MPTPAPAVAPEVVTRLRSAGCVYAEEEAALLAAGARTSGELAAMVDRRAAGEPLEQVLGWAAFCGLRVAVDPHVFVPRRRTELLVETAVALAPASPVVVDLCCGTGAVGLAVASRLDRVELHATDLDPAAVACARRNLAAVDGSVHEGDLDGPLPAHLRGRVDLLLVNAPYVPTDELALLPAEARLHEPRAALDGGSDGLDVQRRVAARAARWLAPGGYLLVETSGRQAGGTVGVLTAAGLPARTRTDPDREATVVTAGPAAPLPWDPGGG